MIVTLENVWLYLITVKSKANLKLGLCVTLLNDERNMDTKIRYLIEYLADHLICLV